ncbi:ABC-2 type transport system permease protein [Pseudoduganella lurida]|uniref:ABC-2 type transport system permease protein n=1 Tax=Pseudoduganella lurida TaxID=1036180 RepID=A0A562RLF9_9BURK|nr:hypothetical protein [Pseudoduganella lurida]TWI69887.1 ABC-2 type transport system permease protein [Pseudoduganella lurida]
MTGLQTRRSIQNRFQWLLRREIWEHQGMMVWLPLAIAALLVGFSAIAIVKGQGATFTFGGPVHEVSSLSVQMGERQKEIIAALLAAVFPLMAAPLYLTLAFMVFAYAMGALYNERRDRSILFWKSLPVSDAATVLSKAAMALLVIPFGMLALAVATSLVILLMAVAVFALHGTNVLPHLLHSPVFWLTPLKLLSLLPVYALWALPTVGWLLMVSSWARSKPFVWAVAAPLLAMAILAWANAGFGLGLDLQWIFKTLLSRLLASVMPGAWFADDTLRGTVERTGHAVSQSHPGAVFDAIYTQSWAVFGTANLWIGALAGAAMIAVAIYVRRRREGE